MRKLSILFLLSFSVLFFGCTGIYEDGTEMAENYKSSIEQISVDDLHKKIESGEEFLLLDIRQPGEYYTENIPGSILLPRGILEFKIYDEEFWSSQYLYPPMKDSTEIVVYCKSGNRGILAVRSLKQLGFKNVKNLEGGYDAFNPNQDPNAKPKASSGGCGG
ncbi:MAG: rhodanese-like domain-containing protein [Bacteroidales bacterium]|nr:rhodanese-like domain-containing protein [Bacteroidales bacterium]